MAEEYTKPVSDVIYITFDWTTWLLNTLGGDTIASSAMSYVAIGSADTNLTITSPAYSHTSSTATVWPSVGTDGMSYYIYNKITTAGGLVRTRVVKLTIRTETP